MLLPRWMLALLALVVALLPGPQARAMNLAETEGSEPAQVLLVASEPSAVVADWAAWILAAQLPIDVTVIGHEHYEPLIDARVYDGFVYLGNHYYQPPGEGFLADLSSVEKPVLWIGYHAWLLPLEFQEQRGLAFADAHSTAFTQAAFYGLRPLPSTDTSAVALDLPARALFWIYDEAFDVALPGAVVSGNFVYMSYLPAFSEDEPDFAPFHAAATAAFGGLGPGSGPAPDYEARVAAARADGYRSAIHLPFIAGEPNTPTTPVYGHDAVHANLLRIREIGAEWVVITRTVFQVGVDGSEILIDPVGTATLEDLANVTQDAHRLGLRVQLSLVLNLAAEGRGPNDWRGMIWPDDPGAWWRDYRRIVLETAAFAREHDIEAFTIGTELSQLERREADWRDLIAQVRESAGYAGLVGYQTNYNMTSTFAWGEPLDYLAVAAYWPLSDQRDPSEEDLDAAWKGIWKEIAAWKAEHPDVRLEFGEIGYASQPYASVFPFSWKPHRAGQLDLYEQEACYLALERLIATHPEIEGVGLFASLPTDTLPGDVGYTPFGKPAEAVAERLMTMR